MSCLTPEEFATIRRHPLLRTRDEFRSIVEAVCGEFGVDPADISAPTRGKAVVSYARNMICLIASQRGFSHRYTGRMINRNHATVVHAISNATATVAAVKAMGSK